MGNISTKVGENKHLKNAFSVVDVMFFPSD